MRTIFIKQSRLQKLADPALAVLIALALVVCAAAYFDILVK